MSEEANPKDEWLAQWNPENAPSCPAGLLLLKDFAAKYPSLYELAKQRDFLDPRHPAFPTKAEWVAFAEHCSTCEDCNEV